MTQENTPPEPPPHPLKTIHHRLKESLIPIEDEDPEVVIANQLKALDLMFRDFVVEADHYMDMTNYYTAALRAQNQYRYTHKHLIQLQNKSGTPPKT